MKKGNFFKFVNALQSEEVRKCIFFRQLIESGGSNEIKLPKKKRYQLRSVKIQSAWDDFKNGVIDIRGILNRLTFAKEKIFDFTDNIESIADSSDIEKFVDSDSSTDDNTPGPSRENRSPLDCPICLIN